MAPPLPGGDILGPPRRFILPGLFVGALFLVVFLRAPESPRWAGNPDKAACAERLWGPDFAAELGVDSGDAGDSKKNGGDSDDDGGDASWATMASPAHRGATATAFLLFVQQQFAGINAVVYFSTKVFRDAGIESAVWSASAVATVSCGLMSTDPFSSASAAP